MLGSLPSFVGDLAEGQRAEIREQQKHADQKSEVADAVDDECLLAGIGRGVFLK